VIAMEFDTARPAIPGLRFRHFAGPEDIPGMVEANMAVRLANGVEEGVDVAGMTHQYANLTNCDVARDLLIIELAGTIAGYVRVDWSQQNDGSRTYHITCLIHPDLLGRGVGTAVLAWAEDRLRVIAADHPTDPPRWFEQESWDAEASGAQFLARHGYEPVRTFHVMVRPTLDDLPEPVVPDGFAIGPMADDGLHALWEAEMKALADHWGSFDTSEAGYAAFSTNPDLEPDLFVVAYAGDEVAGGVRNVIDDEENERFRRRRGTLDGIFVRRPYRRRGLARAMIAMSLRKLRDRGMTSAMLGVDADNAQNAPALYQSFGFESVGGSTVWRKPLETPVGMAQ
jgi:mycothiol synthase